METDQSNYSTLTTERNALILCLSPRSRVSKAESHGVMDITAGMRESDGTAGIQIHADQAGGHTIVVPLGVTEISSYAFCHCRALTSLTLSHTVTSIGEGAFKKCIGLTSLTLPSTLTSVGDDAFSGCTGFTSLTLPDTLTSVGESAFKKCIGLTSLTLPSTLTSVPECVFKKCVGLTS